MSAIPGLLPALQAREKPRQHPQGLLGSPVKHVWIFLLLPPSGFAYSRRFPAGDRKA